MKIRTADNRKLLLSQGAPFRVIQLKWSPSVPLVDAWQYLGNPLGILTKSIFVYESVSF